MRRRTHLLDEGDERVVRTGMTAITFFGFCEVPASSRGAMMTTFGNLPAAESEISQPVFRLFNLATTGPGPIGTGPVER